MNEADVLDRMIQQAQNGINDLRTRLQLEERYLAELRQRRQALALPAGARARPSTCPAANCARPLRSSARVYAGSMPWHILAVLEAAGHEMDVADIAREVEARGVTTTKEGGIRAAVYSSITRRPDLFESMRAGVFDLKSRRTPNGTPASAKRS
jgi:hypothetical protein